MKKRYIVLGVVLATVAIAASAVGYAVLRKPKSSIELAAKSYMAMSDVKSFDIDGTMDATASLGSFLSLPADITFDGNYNIPEQTGVINYTATTTLLGKEMKYSDSIDLSEAATSEEESTEVTTTEETTESTTEVASTEESLNDEETLEALQELFEKSEFNYDKEDQTYTISFKMKDILSVEPIKEQLFGQDSAFNELGITEEQLFSAVNDNAKVVVEFDNKYFVSSVSIDSMDVEKEISLEEFGLGSFSAKATFATKVNITNYQK